ncbi:MULTISPECIES: hypothetical protein [Pedobacter]|uniref:hypothetical protein n=1 Tax=Pedobacter TaxID=84567 RepID=UPI001E29613F|nr:MULTISPECIES: hypothetical protein [Pedobacter]
MKKQITLLSLLLVFTAVLFSCKKDDSSVKARVTGRWSVTKIDVSGYTTADTQSDPSKVNGTITGLSGDYMDFKADNDDQVELSIKGNRTIGTYIGTYAKIGQDAVETINMSFAEGNFYCIVDVLTSNKLQITAKLDKTNVVKVFYLTR